MSGFTLTDQQEAIISEICCIPETKEDQSQPPKLLSVQAVAGASKTTTLVTAVEKYKQLYPNKTVRYLIYGNMAAAEAREALQNNAIVSTIHALAYHYTIKLDELHLSQTGFISWKDIPQYINQPFGKTNIAIEMITMFCQSESIYFRDSIDPEYKRERKAIKLAEEIMEEMIVGNMGCTHDFYLKYFHMRVVLGEIVLPKVDLLLVDEFQDLSPITLDVIRNYPADQKVFVGDRYQSCFSFLGCVNGFEHFPDASQLPLTKSFRVNHLLAEKIQSFCRFAFAPDMDFVGYEYPTIPESKTFAYLTRTNGALISKMIDLNESGTPYKLSSKAKLKQMFELPLALLRCVPGNKEKNPRFKQFQSQVDRWHATPNLRLKYPSRLKYLSEANHDNPDVASAVRMILTHSPETVITAAKSAASHVGSDANLMLMTVHTSKGSTRDEVTIAEDMNRALNPIMVKLHEAKAAGRRAILDKEETSELYLYYIAISRARYRVNNGIHAVGSDIKPQPGEQ